MGIRSTHDDQTSYKIDKKCITNFCNLFIFIANYTVKSRFYVLTVCTRTYWRNFNLKYCSRPKRNYKVSYCFNSLITDFMTSKLEPETPESPTTNQQKSHSTHFATASTEPQLKASQSSTVAIQSQKECIWAFRLLTVIHRLLWKWPKFRSLLSEEQLVFDVTVACSVNYFENKLFIIDYNLTIVNLEYNLIIVNLELCGIK